MGRIGSTALFVYSVITFVGAFVLPLLVRSPDDDGFTRRPPPAVARLVRALDARKPDLVTSWMCGHLVFAAAMFMAPLAKSFRFATALMCICALPWALATWAPLALLGVEVNKMSSGYRPLPDDGGDDMELSAPRKPPPPSAATAELSGVYFGILNVFTALPQFVGAFVAAAIFALLEPGPGPDDAP
ncbi:hypothetical protein CDD83_6028 [Cordyceps sp. RAO-2017]|nr:hypothetical protein CDD83_6028 [Cordyceps sp. RAO-2017]